jgi:multidrug resistance efflux pump
MNTLLHAFAVTLCVAQTSSDGRPTPGELKLPRSMVSLILHNQLPARQAGVIKLLQLEDGTPVQEGMTVTRGQILGKLDDDDARARRRAAETEQKVALAEREKAAAGIKAAEATTKVAQAEVAESEDINRRAPGSVPSTQVRRQQLTVERAASEEIVAHRELETATLTIDAKDAQFEVASITLNHHQIESSIDGIIVQLYRRVGEWVSPGDPIMRIVFIDKVRVEGFVDAESHTPDQIMGRAVEVVVVLPQGRTERFTSVISYVSPLVESGEYRVWCDVDNRKYNNHWILRPGMFAEMTVKLNSPSSKVASRQ